MVIDCTIPYYKRRKHLYEEIAALTLGLPKNFFLYNFMEYAIAIGEPPFPIEIIMPCKTVYTIRDAYSFPTKSLRCPCGEISHWIVKYQLH